MKATFFLNFFLLVSSLYGQEWAPIGAKWHYDITYAFMEDIDYKTVYCDSIINIEGQDCKRINIDYCACNNHFCQKLYTYEKSDTIFFYNEDIDEYQVLFNFNAKIGDNWQISTKDYEGVIDTVLITVDSIGTIMINGISFVRQFVTYSYRYKFILKYGYVDEVIYNIESEIIEKIGDVNFLINVHEKFSGGCDLEFLRRLRCYEDTEIGLYSTGWRDSCNYMYDGVSIDEKQIEKELIFYPNPASNEISIRIKNNTKINYNLYNLNGSLLLSGSGEKVNLRNLENGIYFIEVRQDNQLFSEKIIKHSP